MFITFEGGEGSGKSTVIQQVRAWLEGRGQEVVVTREPGGVALSERLRKLILETDEPIYPVTELMLFLAARAQHVEEKIRPALKSGKTVLCDRFSDSTLAYQGYARELGVERLRPLCEMAAGGLEADLTLYLDIDPEIGLKRAYGALKEEKNDRMEKEKVAFHNKVREGFVELAQKNPDRIKWIDASQPLEKVVKDVLEYVAKAYR